MILWLLWCISIWGFSGLAASMSKHQRDIFSKPVSAKQTKILQILGWGVISLSAFIAIFVTGISVGISEWLGVLTFAALVVGLTMTYWPKRIIQLNIAITILFVILLIIRLI